MDYRDAVIRDLADEGAQLRLELASVAAERDAYRAMTCIALQQLHDAQRRQQHHEDQHARLVDEYRHLRRQIMTRARTA